MVITKCPICNKEFKNYKSTITCSRKCEVANRVTIPHFEGNCLVCGEYFKSKLRISYVDEHPNKTPRFCSQKCMQAWRHVPKVEIECQVCGKKKLIDRSDLKYGRGKFCSKLCNGKFHTGENSQRYKHGESSERDKLRGSPDYRAWRTAVFIRDDRKCVWCGSKENIQADHIKPQALYPELRYDITNGRTLCHSCHKTTPTYGNTTMTKEQFEML